MQREEFVEKYNAIIERALFFNNKTRREGLLAAEDVINEEKVLQRDIFELGMCFVTRGSDEKTIDEILTNIINHEKDDDEKLLKKIQKEAVLRIWQGCSISVMIFLLNSYVDFGFEEAMEIHKKASM
jgi:flagellar motor component MotA